MDRVQKRLMGAAVDRENARHPALYCEAVRDGVIRVHSRPVNYVAESGRLEPINTAIDNAVVANVVPVWRADSNTVQFENLAGIASYRVGQHGIDLTPTGHRPKDGDVVRTKTAKLDRAGSNRITDTGVFGQGFVVTHEVKPGQVKETITIQKEPLLDLKQDWIIAWDWHSESGLVPKLNDAGAILWQDPKSGKTMLVMPAPTGVDAKQNLVPCRYAVDDWSLSVVVPADGFRDVVWPVTIDPTVETNIATANRRTYFGDGASDQNDKMFILIPLPDMTGITGITAATLYLYKTNVYATPNVAVYADVLAVGAWSESSTYSALATLVASFGTATETARTIGGSSGWHTFDVLGTTSTGGVAKAYEDDPPAPDPITCMLKITPDDAADTAATGLTIGFEDGNQMSVFATRLIADQEPYIEIEYTAGGGGGAPFPVIQCA